LGKCVTNSLAMNGQQIGMALGDMCFSFAAKFYIATKVWARELVCHYALAICSSSHPLIANASAPK